MYKDIAFKKWTRFYDCLHVFIRSGVGRENRAVHSSTVFSRSTAFSWHELKFMNTSVTHGLHSGTPMISLHFEETTLNARRWTISSCRNGRVWLRGWGDGNSGGLDMAEIWPSWSSEELCFTSLFYCLVPNISMLRVVLGAWRMIDHVDRICP